jgi:hypothetical protein
MADYPISNVPRRVQYVNSGVGPYAFAFEVLTQTDIAVYRGSTLLTLTTDYTVTINANGTGSVTLVAAGTGNITIVGARAIQRSSDYTTGGDLFASTLNTDLDSQTIFSQQLAEDVDLSIKVPVYAPSSTGLTVNPEANGILAWDSTGTNLINLDPTALVNVAVYATAYADVFVSNGSTVAYTLTRNPGSIYNLDISTDGVTQEPIRDYTLSGSVVTFTSAMPINSRIVIKYKEGLPSVTADSQDVRYLPASGTATTVQSKLRETISVKDFGAIGDGLTDDSASIQSAFNAANGRAIFFPAGTYLSSQKITSSGKSVSLYGASVSSTKVVFTNVSGGFYFVLDSQGASIPPDQLSIQNLTIESRAAVSSPAIDAEWSTYQPNAQGQTWIENVNITRKGDGTGSFAAGILLNKCIVGTISNVIMVGDDARVSSIGLNLIDCVSIKCKQVDINRYDTGVSVTKAVGAATEGFIFDGCTFYDVHKGIFVDGALHVNIINTHVNINGSSATVCIEMVDTAQSYIGAGCLLYAGGLVTDPTGQVAVLIDDCNGIIIENNRIVGVTKANVSEAILIDTSGFVSVNNNAIDFALVGISIPSGTANSLIANTFSNVDTPYADSGTSTFKRLGFKTGPVPRASLDPIWSSLNSSFASGDISVDSNFGGYIKGYSGANADVTLATSGNKGVVNVKDSIDGFFPLLDNAYSVGTSALRYSVVYAATGTINTSDEQHKQDVKDLSDAEHQVAIAIKGLIKSFRFKDAVEKKGDKARIHFGVIAQDVEKAFAEKGLNARDYGLFCADVMEDGTERLGIRYEELLAFVIVAI